MWPVYLKFFLYESKKLWRYPDSALFWENGVTEMTTTKQPIVYIRGSQHVFAILKLLALEMQGSIVREGNNAIHYRFYLPSANSLVLVTEKLKNLALLPFLYFTTVTLPDWQWRYPDFLTFVHNNNNLLEQQTALGPVVLQSVLSWGLTVVNVVMAFSALRTVLLLCLIRRV